MNVFEEEFPLLEAERKSKTIFCGLNFENMPLLKKKYRIL